MIRDHIVVGLRDARLSEKFQLDGALTLDKAVSTVRQAEAVQEQQAALRMDGTNTPIGSVNKTKQTKQWPTRQPNSPGGKPAFGAVPSLTTVDRCALPEMLLAGNIQGRDTSRRSAGETQGLGGYTKRRHHHQLMRVPTRSLGLLGRTLG